MRIIVSILAVVVLQILGSRGPVKDKCETDTYSKRKAPQYTIIEYGIGLTEYGDTIKIVPIGKQIEYTRNHLK